MQNDGIRIVDWYRADPWPRMRRTLLTGPAGLTLGALAVAVSFLTSSSQELRAYAAGSGLALVAGAAIFTVASMHGILRDEAYLAIRTDGVILQYASQQTFVGWDALARARWDAMRNELVLDRAFGGPLVIGRAFARISGPALADRIEHARRKAAMGLLR
jgi:hypothetical protein